MSLNKTAIEWCDRTWNPVTGCKHGCPYCYARKIAERFRGTKAWPRGFEPTFHKERLQDVRSTMAHQSIFVCSMADLFGDWVPDEWIRSVFYSCANSPQHTYLFLTKNPKRYLTIPGIYLGKKNYWFGTTITNAKDAGDRMHWLKRLPEGNTFVSFEPLLGDPGPLDLTGIKQVIIGAQTNPRIVPKDEWVRKIHDAARKAGAKIFHKDSMSGVFFSAYPRELCWSVKK